LRALSLCTCCRHYPGAATGCIPRSSHPAVSAFPDSTIVSACTSSFSRFARRSLALRPAHSRGHQFVTSYPKASDISSPPCLLRLLPAGANRRVGLAPTGKRRLVTAHVESGPSRTRVGPTGLRRLRTFAPLRGNGEVRTLSRSRSMNGPVFHPRANLRKVSSVRFYLHTSWPTCAPTLSSAIRSCAI